jgi:hypothetical protein
MFKFAHIALGGALLLSVVPSQAQTPVAPSTISSSLRPIGAPGVRREAGNWLFNDSIFVSPGENAVAPGSPLFLANLRRDKKEKLPLFRAAINTGPINWATLPLPSLREISVPGYNFTALQATLSSQVSAATAQGRLFVGWSLPTGDKGTVLTRVAVTPVIKQLRAVLDAVAPTSSLILDVDTSTSSLRGVADIDAAAAACDAVLLRVNPDDPRQIWPLKMARRVTEEQLDFDLPIFVAFEGATSTPSAFASRTLEYFMGGATGFVSADTPPWASTVSRNPGLFTGAVTLEDAAILPTQNPLTLQIADALQAAGRIPLVGRLPEDSRRGESLFAVLDDQISLDTLSSIDRAARSGASIYLEGLPDLKNKDILTRLSDMTSTTIEVLPTPRTDVLNMADPWIFGDAKGREFDVTQRIKWTVKSSMANQTRVRKGEDSSEPFAAAKLATDTNGLLVTPLGKGRIIWLPHTPINQDPAIRRTFYAAIAGSLQGSMTEWKFPTVEDEVRNGGKIRVAMRASKTGTSLVALWNDATTDANITLDARGDSPIAFDLLTDKELPAAVVGYSSILKVNVPARGYVWLTFAKTRKALDKERLAARPKARTVK